MPTGAEDMKTLCVIPVRGGSKGIPRKNLAELFPGMSLLEWTIRQAQEVYEPDEIVVSSDDAEMLQVAESAGAQAIARPEALARDESTTASVVDHLLEELDAGGTLYQSVTILQATSPLRQSGDISAARAMLESGQYDSVVSGYREMHSHPAKFYFLDGETARPVLPEFEAARRQDLPPVYRRNGAIFMVTRGFYAQTGKLWGGRTGLAIMPVERSIDIDAPDDLERARSHFAALSDNWTI